ncbi:MAG: hypothetical protein KKE79_00505 [Actinobacteria bacterium]|nr:hypothetical protein [Actinomycetota bacterium]MBU4489099.1 hypothetical protein [Actinomycetota bacterium]MCG2795007.1 hypothetical protein [Actinomycetes bacterium]
MRLRCLMLDESGMIMRAIVKWGILVVFIGLIIVEVGPPIWIRIFAVQNVDDVASAAACDYRMYHDEETARETAAEKLRLMGHSDEEIEECVVEFLPPGNVGKQTVRVTVVKYANTLITRHIEQLKRFARVTTTKEVNIGEAR